jgi:acetamidase/formamidase
MQIDVVLIATTCTELLDAFHSLEGATVRIGLKINENRTKYTAMNTRRLMNIPVLETEPKTFERVRPFTHLGTILTKDNNIKEEVQNGIAVANRAYSASRNTLYLILYLGL